MSKLIRVVKGDETITVHPTCLAAHESVGWVVAADQSNASEEPTTGKGPGGKWFVKRDKERVSGPFETEEDAASEKAALEADSK